MKSDRNTVNMCSVRRWTIRAIGFGFGIVALAAMTFGGAGCPSSRTDTIDLVAVDRGFDDDKALGDEQVLLYFDVLEGGRFQEAEVVLTASGSGLQDILEALLEQDHLFVHTDDATVSIFRNYRSLTDDAASSVELDLSPQTTFDMAIANNRLFVAARLPAPSAPSSQNIVLVWDQVDEMTESRPPDLIIDTLPDLGFSISILAEDDLLLVRQQNSNFFVVIRIMDTDDSKALNYELIATVFPPTLQISDRVNPLAIIDNAIYVDGSTPLLVYEDASSLTDGAQPSAMLEQVSSEASWNYILQIGKYIFTSGLGRYAITVFDSREPLQTSQAPIGGLETGRPDASAVSAGRAFFGLDSNGGGGPIRVFKDATKILHGQNEPDFVIPPFLDFINVFAIDAQEVDN